MRAIQELTKNKTVIIIAHRLKTVKYADQILVVENGKIVQCGTHTQLMKEEGLYKKFIGERREAASWRVKSTQEKIFHRNVENNYLKTIYFLYNREKLQKNKVKITEKYIDKEGKYVIMKSQGRDR